MLPSLVGLIDLRPSLLRNADEEQDVTLGRTTIAWNALIPAEPHYENVRETPGARPARRDTAKRSSLSGAAGLPS